MRDISCTYGTGASHAGVSCGAATSHDELEATTARLPSPTADSTIRGKCKDVTGSVAGRQTIRVVEVRLLPPSITF
jgi:hypothetical protein